MVTVYIKIYCNCGICWKGESDSNKISDHAENLLQSSIDQRSCWVRFPYLCVLLLVNQTLWCMTCEDVTLLYTLTKAVHKGDRFESLTPHIRLLSFLFTFGSRLFWNFQYLEYFGPNRTWQQKIKKNVKVIFLLLENISY